jgi:hypothetical protein
MSATIGEFATIDGKHRAVTQKFIQWKFKYTEASEHAHHDFKRRMNVLARTAKLHPGSWHMIGRAAFSSMVLPSRHWLCLTAFGNVAKSLLRSALPLQSGSATASIPTTAKKQLPVIIFPIIVEHNARQLLNC